LNSTFLFADLAGYTALTEAHGDEQAADAAEHFCDAVRALLPEYDAEEVKAIGDALLVRLADATNAARLAARIVSDYGARHRALGVRVGMHTGSAVRRGHDWFGSAVNLASRVADLAQTGQVLVTEPTRQALHPSFAVRELGPRAFKNVAEPVGVYSLEFEGEAAVGALPIDPVCHMAIEPDRAATTRSTDGRLYYFCSPECAAAFDANPSRYIRL
jgi:class 3 adenylate cyclase/YHS domain-containing protein